MLFRFAVAAALTGAFSGWALVGQFGLIALGGLGLGIAMGWITSQLRVAPARSDARTRGVADDAVATYLLCEAAQVWSTRRGRRRHLRAHWGHEHIAAVARLNIGPSGALPYSSSIAWYSY